jgi:hypothetical protein
MWLEALGWIATAFFASSYFFKRPAVLRKIQACAALLWIVYGFATLCAGGCFKSDGCCRRGADILAFVAQQRAGDIHWLLALLF